MSKKHTVGYDSSLQCEDEVSAFGGQWCYVTMCIDGKVYKGLVDSAATCSVVGESFYQQCLPNLALTQNSVNIRGVSGSKVKSLGTITLPFVLGQTKFVQSFLVVPDCSNDIILGVDFLQKHKCKIDLDSNQLTLATHNGSFVSLPMYSQESLLQCRKVVLPSKTVIPALSEMILSCQVCGPNSSLDLDGITGLTIRNHTLINKKCVTTAIGAVRVVDNHIPVRLMNPMTHDTVLWPGQTLCYFEPYESINAISLEHNIGDSVPGAVESDSSASKQRTEFDYLSEIDLSDSLMDEQEKQVLVKVLRKHKRVFVRWLQEVGLCPK